MGWSLSPIEIAAIGTAGLAGLVITVFIIYSIHRHRRRLHRNRRSPLPNSHSSQNLKDQRVVPPGSRRFDCPMFDSSIPPPFPAASLSPSHTTLVTPDTANRLKKNGAGVVTPVTGPPVVAEDSSWNPFVMRPESEEMVVYTYEEGLEKLGRRRPSDTPSYSDPPAFEQATQAYPTARPNPSNHYPPSHNQATGLPSAASTMSRQGRGRSIVGPYRTAHRKAVPLDVDNDQLADNTAGRPDGQSDSGSIWMPSYYRSPEAGRLQFETEESDLGYRHFDVGQPKPGVWT